MNRKYKIIFTVFTLIILLTACSTNTEKTTSNKINQEVLRINDTTSNRISSDFGMLLIEFTIEAKAWYNIYVDYLSENEIVKELEDRNMDGLFNIIDQLDNKVEILTDVTTNKMIQLKKDGIMNEFEVEIAKECLDIVKVMGLRGIADAQVNNSLLLKEVNLNKLDDKEFNRLINSREDDAEEIKKLIEGSIENYFE